MGKDFTRPLIKYQPSEAGLDPYERPDQFEWVEGTHSLLVGYVLWIFGWMGAHRFYYGKPISGTVYLLTGGLFLVGWLVDIFLIPAMDREADIRFVKGPYDYTVAFLLLTFLGIFGLHRMYIGKWASGLIWLLTMGVFGFGVLFDFWTLNEQVSYRNADCKA